MFGTYINGTRVDIDTAASVTEFIRDDGKTSQVLMFEVPGHADELHVFQMGGRALIPTMTTVASYNSFMSHITGLTPTLPEASGRTATLISVAGCVQCQRPRTTRWLKPLAWTTGQPNRKDRERR